MLKLDLGGGLHPKKGFVSVDRDPGPDGVFCNFDHQLLPFEDGSVDEVFTSHALEHLLHPVKFLREICRVAKLGARVEIRVPFWLSSMAMCDGHVNTISPRQMDMWTRDFLPETWGADPKRLALKNTILIPSDSFQDAKAAFPHMSDAQVLRFAPDACHEVRFVCEVVEYRK